MNRNLAPNEVNILKYVTTKVSYFFKFIMNIEIVNYTR